MAYADFTMSTVINDLGIKVVHEDLFLNVAELEPSAWLRQTMALAREVPLLSEKARSEFLVAPVLLECRERSGNRFSIYSGERLDVDGQRGLVGECDFILSLSAILSVLEAPIAIVLEAKRGFIEGSLGQCAAQMLGARIFNEKLKSRQGAPVFGCVTTGQDWQFMRLDAASLLTIDKNRYFMPQLPLILGIFQAMLASCGVDAAAA